MISITHKYYLFKKQTWFDDSCASYHLTPYSHLFYTKKPYVGQSNVCVANGLTLAINCVSFSRVIPKSNHTIPLALNDILYVHCIARNLLSFSKFSKYNNIVFKFIATKCYVKFQVSKLTLL